MVFKVAIVARLKILPLYLLGMTKETALSTELWDMPTKRLRSFRQSDRATVAVQ
jgi:hypothetical protein